MTARTSLRWHLVRRLLVLQTGLLALLVIAIMAALLWTGQIGALGESEDLTIAALRDAITRDTDGALRLRPTPALAELRAQSPGLWFVVRDRQGHRLAEGPVPDEYARIGGGLDTVGQARLGWNLGDDPARQHARMKWLTTDIGEIQILAGPGGQVPLGHAALLMALFFATQILPFIAVMAVATLIVTPIVVRRALGGLAHVAAEARCIDINQRNMRLSTAHVPVEIEPLVSAVNAALDRLDQGYSRQKRFLGYAAHELRTPIAILWTRLESLPPQPEQRRLIEDVARLANLAEQLLDVERLSHRAEAFAPVDLVALGRHVAAELAPLAVAAGYALGFDTTLPRFDVHGDALALERALTNLVQNAIEHGGRRGTITISVDDDGALAVMDEGSGIPAQERDHIFEPFYRLTSHGRGAGLGLHLVGEIVGLHKGRILVGDGASGGACIRVMLPPLSRTH